MNTYTCGQDCERCGRCRPVSRRHFMRQLAGGLALCGVGALAAACAPLADEPEPAEPPPTSAEDQPDATSDAPPTYVLPMQEGTWTPPIAHTGDQPAGQGAIDIQGLGTFSFDAAQVQTVRPDIFRPGHFSLFDVLVHLQQRGDIALDHHFDEALDTHVIDALDGTRGWWHQAYYANGWPEPNVFRMDMYPYKNNTRIALKREDDERLDAIHDTLREEVARLAQNGGRVILPSLAIRSPVTDWTFEDVVVTPHDVRSDVLQPGVVTALDALISLREQEQLPTLKLTWYERIGRADPVDSYWVEQVDDAEATGGCGLVYETGPSRFSGFSGSHIHIPADVRVTVSPEYALWFWICL